MIDKFVWNSEDLVFEQKEEDFSSTQIPPSPFRKRLPLMLAKDLSYLNETAGGALVPSPDHKDGSPESSELERAEHSDLITLPDGVEGTNCGNCRFVDKTQDPPYCLHEEVEQSVTPRMCCKYWDSEGAKRAWEQEGKKNIDEFLTKGEGTCKQGERSDLTGCTPVSGEAGTPKPKGPEKEEEAVETWRSKLKEIPATIIRKAKQKVLDRYNTLEGRYGRKYALAIIAAGIVGTPIPVPGATLAAVAPVIVLAELHRRLIGVVAGQKDLQLTPEEIEKLGKEFVAELLEGFEKDS